MDILRDFTLCTLLYALYSLFLKHYYQFLLLKEMYPDKAKGVVYWLSFKANIFLMQFNLGVQIWLFSPVYFTQFPLDQLNKKAMSYHYKLKNISIRFIISFSLFIIFSFLYF